MSDCCEDNLTEKKADVEEGVQSQEPKSFIGRFLYRVGKKDAEKEAGSGEHKGGCC